MADPYVDLAVARVRSIAGAPRLFVLRAIGEVLLVLAEMAAPLVLVDRFGSFAGWSGSEVVLLISVVRAGEGMAYAVARGIDPSVFGESVRLGRFDQALTRPVSPLVWIALAELEVRHLFRSLAGAATVAWLVAAGDLGIGLADLALLAAAAVAVAVLIVSVLVMGAALTFVTTEASDAANVFVNGGVGLVSYPLDVYGRALRFTFTFVLPIGLCAYLPVAVVTGHDAVVADGLLAAVPVVLGAFVAAAAAAWRGGLRRYRSTGS